MVFCLWLLTIADQLPRFFAYEEYGAKYEMMVRDLAATYKTTGSNDAFERGIEVLSRTLESINNRDEHGKKGLSFADLVIKVCKVGHLARGEADIE